MTRLATLTFPGPFVAPFSEDFLLTWPTVAENVDIIAAGCGETVVRASDSAFRVTQPGWFHVGAGLLGEAANCVDADDFMAGLYIELDRGGATSVMVGDIKGHDVCRSYSYNCSIERRLEADDILRAYFHVSTTVGAQVSGDVILPSSSRNQFSIRLIRRA
jgi:hypothetical protein